MIRFLVSLSIGVYAGIYIAQNYEVRTSDKIRDALAALNNLYTTEVPRVDEPAKLYQRVLQFLDENKKKP